MRGGVPMEELSKTGLNEYSIVHLVLPDIDGTLRERRQSIGVVRQTEASASFCNALHKWDLGDSVYRPGPFVGERLAIDWSSVRPYPFEHKAAWVVADFDGPSRATSSRALLAKQIAHADRLGLGVRAAFEFEWLVFREDAESIRGKRFDGLAPFAPDNRCWDALTAAIHSDMIAAHGALLASANIGVHGLGMELGHGCMEATLTATDPMRAADDAALFKLCTKAFFRRQGMTACFMAQSDADAPGMSGHINLSLRDANGDNLFQAENGALTVTARHFIGGVLRLLPEGIVLAAHTVNAYRRMSPGNWAPRTATWSLGGYTTAIRAVPGTTDDARLEFRIPGADVNPWLGLAFFLRAGLWGIENRVEPPQAAAADGREDQIAGLVPLPRDLRAAAEAFEASETMRAIFGDEFVTVFAHSRRHEFDALRRAVSRAEKARYFESV
jgi:glutamine synthetase